MALCYHGALGIGAEEPLCRTIGADHLLTVLRVQSILWRLLHGQNEDIVESLEGEILESWNVGHIDLGWDVVKWKSDSM